MNCNNIYFWFIRKNITTVLPLSLYAPIASVKMSQNIIFIYFIITIVTTLIIIITQLKQDLLLFLTRAVTSWQSMAPPIQTQSGQVSTNACAAAVSYSCLMVLSGFVLLSQSIFPPHGITRIWWSNIRWEATLITEFQHQLSSPHPR